MMMMLGTSPHLLDFRIARNTSKPSTWGYSGPAAGDAAPVHHRGFCGWSAERALSPSETMRNCEARPHSARASRVTHASLALSSISHTTSLAAVTGRPPGPDQWTEAAARVKTKVAPLPGAEFSSQMRPAVLCTSRWQIASPIRFRGIVRACEAA